MSEENIDDENILILKEKTCRQIAEFLKYYGLEVSEVYNPIKGQKGFIAWGASIRSSGGSVSTDPKCLKFYWQEHNPIRTINKISVNTPRNVAERLFLECLEKGNG